MMNIFLIFFGAGIGGVLRYALSKSMYYFLGQTFPYGTLIVNVTGCFLTGLIFVVIMDRFAEIAPQLRSFILIGLLGGYTTFSSFSIETLNLLENGAWISAILNIFFSIVLCMLAVWLGVVGGRQV